MTCPHVGHAEALQGDDHQLAFAQEVILTPAMGFATSARPDVIYRLPGPWRAGRGVERGGTTTNTHDLTDLWRTHIAPDGRHLFLVVRTRTGTQPGWHASSPSSEVLRRLAAFFGDPRREVDVISRHVFGHGQTRLQTARSVAGTA